MNKVVFDPIPINPNSLTSKLLGNQTQSDKYLRVSSSEQKKIVNVFTRGILCQCLSSEKVFKVEPFKKLITETMKIALPPGTLMYARRLAYYSSPILNDVNDYLMEVFGYCIAPINYASRATIRDNINSIKELVLVNVLNNPTVNEANNESWDAAEQGKLFWTVCFLYLCNGSEMDKLKSHLHTITGDSMKLIGEYLDRWERQRYINTIKNRTSEGEIVRYEVGLRAFHEIGYHNITKFVSKIEGFELTQEIVEKWLNDTLDNINTPKKDKKEKITPKRDTPKKVKGRKRVVEEEEELSPDLSE